MAYRIPPAQFLPVLPETQIPRHSRAGGGAALWTAHALSIPVSDSLHRGSRTLGQRPSPTQFPAELAEKRNRRLVGRIVGAVAVLAVFGREVEEDPGRLDGPDPVGDPMYLRSSRLLLMPSFSAATASFAGYCSFQVSRSPSSSALSDRLSRAAASSGGSGTSARSQRVA